MFAIGLERIVYTQKYDHLSALAQAQIAEIRDEVRSRSAVMHLRGSREIYVTGERLVRESQNRIQAFVVGSGVKAPKEWAQAVADRLRSSRKSGVPIKYETVIGLDFEQVPPDFSERVAKRHALYSSQGVGDLSSLSLLDLHPPIGFDILIVDRRHVALAFSPHEGTDAVDQGIVFYDQPVLASAFADWFDERLRRRAIAYECWLTRVGKTASAATQRIVAADKAAHRPSRIRSSRPAALPLNSGVRRQGLRMVGMNDRGSKD
jgi:hypothetical protein